jgi:hypothetical protein
LRFLRPGGEPFLDHGYGPLVSQQQTGDGDEGENAVNGGTELAQVDFSPPTEGDEGVMGDDV